MSKDFCFIISSYCESESHILQLRRCLLSIRKWHENLIVIIDDFSEIDIFSSVSDINNLKIIKSQVKGAGDMVTYFNFTDIDDFEIAVIIQDSMTLEHPLENIDKVDKIVPIWYFTNHRLHWNIIPEPQTTYNISNNIKVHDDLIIDFIKKMINKEDFKKWLLEIYHKKEKWSGNIGCQSIINKNFLYELNDKTDIINMMFMMDNNRLRRVAESLFPLACQFVLGDSIVEKSYDGLYYDGVNQQNGYYQLKASDIGIGESHEIITQVCKNKYFSKITFNRRP